MFNGDYLLNNVIGICSFAVFIDLIQVLRCSYGFKECRLMMKFHSRMSYCKELVSFGGWNLFGALGAVGSNQMMAFLINIYHGPRVNASFGLANQVSGQANGIAQGLFNAIAPEITSSEGRGDRERVITLSLLASKFSVLMLCLVLIPFMIEIDTILGLWLKEVPQYTAALCRIVVISFLIDKLTIGYMVAVAAKGQIAGYQATLGGALICTPFIAWILFKAGCGVAVSVGSALLITRTFCALGRVWWVRRLMGVPMRLWVNRVFLRCFASIMISVLCAVLLLLFLEESILRTALSFVICGLALSASAWLVGLDGRERQYIQNLFKSVIRKLRIAYAKV